MGKKSNIRAIIGIGLLVAIVLGINLENANLNEIAVVSGIGIDKYKGQYIVTLQKYNPSANTKEASDEIAAYTYKQQGETIPEAINKVYKQTSRQIFLDSVQIIVISERLAKSEGLSKAINYLIRDPRLHSNIVFFISKDIDPYSFFRVFMPVEKVSGVRFKQMLEKESKRVGRIENNTLEKADGILLQKTTELTIPYMTVHGDIKKGFSKASIEQAAPSALAELEGLSIFKEDKLTAFLSTEETRVYTLTQGKIREEVFTGQCPANKGRITWVVKKGTSAIHVNSLAKQPTFRMQINLAGSIQDMTCELDVTSPQIISKLEKQLGQELQKQVQTLIHKSQSYHTDFIGFSDAIYRRKPAEWVRISKHWDAVFPKSDIQTRVNVKLIDTGDLTKIPK